MCANALSPTYGWWVSGATFVTSLIACAILVISLMPSPSRTWLPRFSWRPATTLNRFALPARSPYPLAVPCTWVTPASTATRVFATPQPVSSWQWMPSRAWVWSATARTTSPSSVGSMPPLVSHSAITSAPASAAARTHSSA